MKHGYDCLIFFFSFPLSPSLPSLRLVPPLLPLLPFSSLPSFFSSYSFTSSFSTFCFLTRCRNLWNPDSRLNKLRANNLLFFKCQCKLSPPSPPPSFFLLLFHFFFLFLSFLRRKSSSASRGGSANFAYSPWFAPVLSPNVVLSAKANTGTARAPQTSPSTAVYGAIAVTPSSVTPLPSTTLLHSFSRPLFNFLSLRWCCRIFSNWMQNGDEIGG